MTGVQTCALPIYRFIPRAQLVDSMERPYGHDLVDVETGEYLGDADLPIREIERLQDKFHLFGYLPYLRKFDLQLFFICCSAISV